MLKMETVGSSGIYGGSHIDWRMTLKLLLSPPGSILLVGESY